MSREGFEGFSRHLTENPECQAKAKGFGGDVDALSAYARELGYNISSEELREYQQQVQKFVQSKIKKAEQSRISLSEGAKAFYKLMELAESDEGVARRLEELSSGTPEELIAYGKEKGFIFTEQDIKDVSKDILEPQDELSEEELELVAGGTTVFAAILVVGGVTLGLCAVGAVVGIILSCGD